MTNNKIVILIPLELNKNVDKISDEAVKICKHLNASAHLLHVLDVSLYEPVNTPGYIDTQHIRYIDKKTSITHLKRLKHIFQNSGIRTDWEIRLGFAADDIINAALDIGADYILLGEKKRGLISEIIGGTVEAVLSRANCPVIVIRHDTLTSSGKKAVKCTPS